MSTLFKTFVLVGYVLFSVANGQSALDALTKLSASNEAPKVYQSKILEDGFRSFYFDGADYQGKPTRIFSYYREPEGTGPFPAVVLVHGGGGTAFKDWVKEWNNAGFSAISIAVEGQTATLTGDKKIKSNKWVKHAYAGPSRNNIYKDNSKPLTEQWMYHALSATINAHNLLRSFSSIDSKKIGLSGISWGGVITSTTIGFDQRFAFAIPIYGCGFLDTMDNQYGEALKNNDVYKQVWEPGLRISKFTNPTLWLTGLKDKHFSLNAQASTYKLLKGSRTHSIQPELKHGHSVAWEVKEPYSYANKVINDVDVVNFYQESLVNEEVEIRVNNIDEIASASFYYTFDTGHTSKRKWHMLPALIEVEDAEVRLTSDLPSNASAWFFNITSNELTYSSELSER